MSEFEMVGAEIRFLSQDWIVLVAEPGVTVIDSINEPGHPMTIRGRAVSLIEAQAQLWDACGTIAAMRLAALAVRP